jgi:tripartite-type tricarboxylate transporter receptor subunit TctC
MRYPLLALLAANVLANTPAPAAEEHYPVRPVRIVTAPPGGPNDFLSRIVASEVNAPLGQQVVVENRPAGVIPGQVVAAASPDGYTMLCTSGILWILPFLQHVPFDAVKDFTPITLATSSPTVLAINASVPANSVKELIALARAKPGTLNYGTGATASNSHLSGELFRSLAGIDIVRVPYKGEGPAFLGLLGGESQMMFISPAAAAPHVKTGKVKVLAVSSARPSALAPGLPTIAAAGVPGYEALIMLGFLAPARTPAAIVKRLNQEIVTALRKSDVKEKLFASGVEVVANSPEEFAAMIQADRARMGKLVKDAGIRIE